MSRRSRMYAHPRHRPSRPATAAGQPRSWRPPTRVRRARGMERLCHRSFAPPELWYEPSTGVAAGYRVVVLPPGDGYRHVVTPEEIEARLARLPSAMLQGLDVVQLSRMTRKKRLFPCYGLQWGRALYLYPLPADLVERYARPPRPAQRIEAAMYGGRWEQDGDGAWRLLWTVAAARDFYLNNILIHELGHLLDRHNSTFTDRERYAEWFAIHFGYKPSRRATAPGQPARRRHHSSAPG